MNTEILKKMSHSAESVLKYLICKQARVAGSLDWNFFFDFVCFFAFGDHFKPFWAKKYFFQFFEIFKKFLSPNPLYQGVIGSKIFFSIFCVFLHPGTILSHFERKKNFLIFLGIKGLSRDYRDYLGIMNNNSNKLSSNLLFWPN